jgi:endonuclease/exonuclease/phosphatase family metal-dependent hydrolase
MRGAWHETSARDNACRGDNYGIAVLTRGEVGHTTALALSRPVDDETRTLLCIGTRLRVPMTLCTTHIITADYPSLQVRQVARLAGKVNAFVARGMPVVLMGDFNVLPPSDTLDPLYAQRYGGEGHGHFTEADHGSACRCGEATHSAGKLDYIFLSERDWKSPSGDAVPAPDLPDPLSFDHDPLVGAATRRT